MIKESMDVLEQFPVRKSKKQKAAFREAAAAFAQAQGYTTKTERGSYGATNLIIGEPSQAKYLVTAHYDTCARLPIPNFITPCNFWMFLLYQLAMTAVMFGPVFAAVFAVRHYFGSVYAFATLYLCLLAVIYLMYAGPSNKHNANDNTSGVVTLLETAKNLPAQFRPQVCFVLFDLEEAGLVGSSAYAKAHKAEISKQTVLNLDCVGDGEEFVLFPTSKLKKNGEKLQLLERNCKESLGMPVHLHKKGFSYYPSDQARFPYGVGICALRKHKRIGYYMGRIHTPRDTVLEEKNIKALSAWLLSVFASEIKERK